MPIKKFSEITQDLISKILSKKLDANVSVGTLLRDVVIDAPSFVISDLYLELDKTQKGQILDQATGTQLDDLLSNFSIFRKKATRATGSVFFRTATAPGSDVTIPIGTVVSTNASVSKDASSFTTLETVTMVAASASQYRNEADNVYEIQAKIEALTSGISSNVAASAITNVSNVTGITSVINKLPTTGGTEEESDILYRNRGKTALVGLNIGSISGYTDLVLAQDGIDSIFVVTANNSDFNENSRVKDGGLDIYVKTTNTKQVTDSYTFPAGEKNRIVTSRPLVSISQVKVAGVFQVLNLDYSISKDTGSYARSVFSTDKIVWLKLPTTGNAIDITYTYLDKVKSTQDLLDRKENHIAGSDILVRAAYKASVDVTLSFAIIKGFSSTSVTSDVVTAITNYINALDLGQDVQQSQLIASIEVISGVDFVNVPSITTFTVTREISNVADKADTVEGILQSPTTGNLLIKKNEYAVTRTITITAI